MVDLLLRSGADETITDEEGETPTDAIGQWFGEDEDEDPLVEEIERVRRLLANAPADRAWRRRGYLVLCRAHPDRVQLGQESSSENGGVARRTRRRAKLAKAEGSRDSETAGGATAARKKSCMQWAGVVVNVLGIHEEGVFRTIVGFL